MAVDALVERLLPGSSRDARPASEKELNATEVLTLDIEEESAWVRKGPPTIRRTTWASTSGRAS